MRPIAVLWLERDHRVMSFDKVLEFFVGNVTSVIEWLFLGILSLVAIYLYRSLRGDSASETTPSQLAEIEKTLKRVLESAPGPRPIGEVPQVPGAANPDPASPSGATDGVKADSAASNAALEAAKQEREQLERKLADLQKQLTEAKTAGAQAAPSPGPQVDTKPLEARIKELEGKLSDYEIIADDIANLSLYKAENARLKNELAGGKSSPSAPGPAAPADRLAMDQAAIDKMLGGDGSKTPSPPPANDTRAALEALVDQVNSEREQNIPPSGDGEEIAIESAISDFDIQSAEAAVAASAPADEQSRVDQLMAQFEKTIDRNKAEAEIPAPVQASAVEKPQAPNTSVAPAEPEVINLASNPVNLAKDTPAQSQSLAAETTKSISTPAIGDDIMAEFAEAAEQVFREAQGEAVVPESAPAPAAAAPATSSAPTSPPASTAPSTATALDVKLDADTVLSEVAAFEKAPPTNKKPGDDATQLIEEFESFMKTS